MSNSSTKICVKVDLLKDIEFEGDKNFTFEIVHNSIQRLMLSPQRTTVTITDYNCESLWMLVHTAVRNSNSISWFI